LSRQTTSPLYGQAGFLRVALKITSWREQIRILAARGRPMPPPFFFRGIPPVGGRRSYFTVAVKTSSIR